MQLPEGVFHRPRERHLIAKDGPAVIEIATRGFPGNEQYKVNQRLFDFAIAPYLKGDWADLDRLFRLKSRRVFKEGETLIESPFIYSGAEHIAAPKKPNITVLPNLQISELRGIPRPISVLGCTMGHWHICDSGTPRIQEVYEFQSHGLLVIDREDGEAEVWVAKDGDKVAVPSACHMTLYNLGDEDHPLITLDFADPNRNRADKKAADEIGPLLLGHYDDLEAVFTVNYLHINNTNHKAGVRLPVTPRELQDRQVKVSRVGRLDLGAFLYEQLTQNCELIGSFAKLGIRIKKATPEAALAPYPGGTGPRTYFSRPLVDAMRPGTNPYKYFISDHGNHGPALADEIGIAGRESRVAREKKRLGHPKLQHSHVLIVVEGAGDWVTDAYRPVLKKLAKRAQEEGKRISVVYADDSRWKDTPEWTRKLDGHETYVDKANADDFALYRILRPDLVFVVTPDFTHSALAKWWLNRKAPLVFVEKPFDSQLGNVETLFNALGRHPVTTVLGLDHYQFRAQGIREILPEIVQHLGGALTGVEFYMTEEQPLELGRIRTLQYGLTLDMLPHMLALLAFFGDVGSIDDIQALDAGRYGPEFRAKGKDPSGEEREEDVSDRFHNETYSTIRFTFEDYSGSGHRVPCTAVVGKGFKRATKYLEMMGQSGNAVRIEFGMRKDSPTGYPWSNVMLLIGGDDGDEPGTLRVSDPHQPGRTLRINPNLCAVEASKEQYYLQLIEDLTNGTSATLGSTLLPGEAWEIVRALDRIWWAIQDFKVEQGWSEQPFQQIDPIEFARRQSVSEK